MIWSFISEENNFLKSAILCKPFTQTSFWLENLSNTLTILATQFLKKTLNGKATAQSCDWLVNFLSHSLGSYLLL